MYLSLIEIKNFRSLKELRVELQPGLNVLVGRNNTGKTNLLQAIRHAIGPNGSRGDALRLDRDDFYKASPKDETERTISITLTFSCLSKAQRAFFYEIVEFDLENLTKSKAIIRFEASWPKKKRWASIKRTGGPKVAESPEVPAELLSSLPITFLPALRDAEGALTPGYRSRLALLLRDLAERSGGDAKNEIEKIYSTANEQLEKEPLIRDTKKSLQLTTKDLAGTDYCPSSITAAPINFDKILRSLQVQMDGVSIGSLDANGLGYNNLLYMAVVLEHLKSPDENECPLFLVEEPEAHLHPQLTTLLAEYLAKKTPGKSAPQTIVTTHSPTLAASIPPSRVHLLFTKPASDEPQCNSIAKAGMSEKEEHALVRMMDITRATLYFAKAVILVEGISESLLIPVLAKRLGHNLAKLHISVIPICGVAFETFKKLLNPKVLGIPVAIVTDADPPITRGESWQNDKPEPDGKVFKLSDRTQNLKHAFSKHETVEVFLSELTLEYDLAKAGDENAKTMALAWEECFIGNPGTFNQQRVAAAAPSREEKAMTAWRGICRSENTGSKAAFAHRLAAILDEKNKGSFKVEFEVPGYLKDAIEHVVSKVKPPAPVTGA